MALVRSIARSVARSIARGQDAGGGPAPSATAIVVHGVGQSLMATRADIVQPSGGDAIMAVGGAHISSFSFWAENPQRPPHSADWASTATFAEALGQTPLAGVANVVTGYDDRLLHSSAIGARTLEVLHIVFASTSAAIERSVANLVALGHARSSIDYVFLLKHGEANASAGTSQADYEALLSDYITRCRIAVKQALRDPSYVAKFHISFPIQQKETDDDRAIKRAILAVVDTLPNVTLGEVYSVPVDVDRVHPQDTGYVLMGERAASQMVNNSTPLRCTSLTGAGTSWTATFNKSIVRDASFGWGTSLNAANAEDGLEVWDQGAGAYIAINSLSYGTNSIGITLASPPSGTVELRIACQDVAAAYVNASGPPGTADNANHVGCAVRSTEAGWASTFDPTYTHYDWCIPQVVEAT